MKYAKLIKSAVLILVICLAIGILKTDNAKAERSANKVKRQKGWYIRLVTESDDLRDYKTVFGYLQGASDLKDKYDSEALSSGGPHYLYTTINHPEFEGAKEYRSDYRAFQKVGKKSDTWMIVVHCGDAFADVTLSWDGITKVKKNKKGVFVEKHRRGKNKLGKMVLFDEENNRTIDVKSENSYTFNMNGNREYILTWVLKKDGEPARASRRQAAYDNSAAEERNMDADQESGFMEDFIAPEPKKK